MPRRGEPIVRLRKGALGAGGAGAAGADVTSADASAAAVEVPVNPEEVGAKFGAAAKRIVDTSFDPGVFLNDQVYGNLMSTESKQVEKKRTRVSEAFAKVLGAVAWLLKSGVPKRDQESESFRSARASAAILADWRELVKQHPHKWPASPIYSYILDLRKCLLEVNKAVNNALELGDAARFCEWRESEKILLPSDGPKHKFFGLDLSMAYPYAKDIYDQTGVIVVEFCTPPYAWKIAIASNVQGLLARSGFAPNGLGDTIRQWAYKEIYKQYLSKLGIIDHKLEFSTLIPSLAREANMGTAKSALEAMLGRRDVASKIFGGEAVEDMSNVLKKMKSEEAKFDEAPADAPPAAAPPDASLSSLSRPARAKAAKRRAKAKQRAAEAADDEDIDAEVLEAVDEEAPAKAAPPLPAATPPPATPAAAAPPSSDDQL